MSTLAFDQEKFTRLVRQAVAEGVTLLKNDGEVLPLAEGTKIALFGRSQFNYYKSGTGSGGMVNVSKVTGITDGLLEAGVKLNEKLLDTYRKWDEANPYDLGAGWGGEPWSQAEMPLDEALVAETAAVCHRADCRRGAG